MAQPKALRLAESLLMGQGLRLARAAVVPDVLREAVAARSLARAQPSELPQGAEAEVVLSVQRLAAEALPWVEQVVGAVPPSEVQEAEAAQLAAVQAAEVVQPLEVQAAEVVRPSAAQAGALELPLEALAARPSAEPSARLDRLALAQLARR